MGRFTSVQAYTDNNSSIRKVTYEQAAAGASGGGDGTTNAGGIRANVRPEKVVNPYGSTAGAGSGEFHLYRHGRNREMLRLRNMDVAARVTAANAAYSAERAADAAWSEARTAAKRKKRERAKEAKRRKQNLKKSGINVDVDVVAAVAAARPGVAAAGESSEEEEDNDDEAQRPNHPDEEFTYIPGTAVAPLEDEAGVVDDKKGAASGEDSLVPDEKRSEQDNMMKKLVQQQPLLVPVEIPNDGSFLELMSKKLAEAASAASASPN